MVVAKSPMSPNVPTGGQREHPTLTMGVNVMIYSWNSDGSQISKQTLSQWKVKHTNPNEKIDPKIPDYLDDIAIEIRTAMPDVVFFATQRSLKPGDYLHSDSLPTMMTGIKDGNGVQAYKLLKRTRSMGTGGTAKAAKNVVTVSAKVYGLRNSVYVRVGLHDDIEHSEKDLRTKIGDTFQKHYSCGSGVSLTRDGLASYIKIPGQPVIALINCYIAHNRTAFRNVISTKGKSANTKYINEYSYSVYNISECLTSIIKTLGSLPVDAGEQPGYVIVCGDLGYRATPRDINMTPGYYAEYMATQKGLQRGSGDASQSIIEKEGSMQLRKSDELSNSIIAGTLTSMKEGITHRYKTVSVDGKGIVQVTLYEGPMFMPTCTLRKNRKTSEPLTYTPEKGLRGLFKVEHSDYNPGDMGENYPSWCDRILYKSSDDRVDTVECTMYDRFDYGNMKSQSTHAGVKALIRVGFKALELKDLVFKDKPSLI